MIANSKATTKHLAVGILNNFIVDIKIDYYLREEEALPPFPKGESTKPNSNNC
ncbi:hypothetical protein Riv7116_1468 [Rivularia sp. PCC 7116]|nr:hypothetical protein Riv7116_1468 [Rivularia sp. PCC 7116]